MDLAGQLGGDHQQVARQMQGKGEVDRSSTRGYSTSSVTTRQQLTSGVYRQHADAQQQPEFDGRPAGGSQAHQLPSVGRQGGQDDGSSRAISLATST